jgi:hypothetical protein
MIGVIGRGKILSIDNFQTAKGNAMAFADPQSITINAVATSLPRTSSGANSGTFTSNDGLIRETVSHAYGKRIRRTFRIDHSKVAADPFLSGVNTKYSMSAYIVVDVPVTGYTVTEAKQVVDGLMATLTASSGSKITQLLGGEI